MCSSSCAFASWFTCVKKKRRRRGFSHKEDEGKKCERIISVSAAFASWFTWCKEK